MVAEGDGGHLELMAFHPVLVAANRVDLAIVRKRAEGLRQPPLRKGVGGITLVEDRDAALEPLVEQVGVEDRQRLGQEQALVDDRPARQRADVEALNLGLYRSEENTSELQSIMRQSYAVFCLKK